jgi:hypothetical protein
MAIVFWCRCGTEVTVPDRDGGRRKPCPGCGVLLQVPMPLGTGPAPPAPRPASLGYRAALVLLAVAIATAVGVLAWTRLGR